MATNWKMNEIIGVLNNGKTEDIQDLGRRFPLTAVAIASGDFAKVLGALPDHITVRKVESILKGDVADSEDEDTEVEEKEEKPVEKKSGRGRKPKAKAEEVEDEDSDDDPVALYKECKKAGLKVEARKSAKYYKDALAKAKTADEDSDDDWDDEEEEAPKKPAKKAEKKPAKKAAKKEEPDEDADDEDGDDWDI